MRVASVSEEEMGWTEVEEGAGAGMEGEGLEGGLKVDLVGEGMEEWGMEVEDLDWDLEEV